MAKVTEQDLLDRGFKKEPDDIFEKEFNHIIFGRVTLFVVISAGIIGMDVDWDYPQLPLTHANLDLFIRFAEGKEL